MIDWARINDLRDEVGRDDFGEIVALFLAEADESVALLVSDQPPDRLAKLLHALKGSALNLGFEALAALCAGAEALAAAGGVPDISAISEIYARSRAAFESGWAAVAA
jgi:HPt (histidine-containing phosphotransfer) domain-containing protein